MLERTERLEINKNANLMPGTVELVIGDGPDKGRKFRLKKKSIIGSSDGCDIRLLDKFVSKKHIEVEIDRQSIAIKDLKSTNGTFIGSQNIKEANISFYETVRIGKTLFSILPKPHNKGTESCGLITSSNTGMKELFRNMRSVANSRETVLIHGETGTGKELVAKSLHSISDSSGAPFIAVNCGALAPELIESELFGHIKGAFTGAERFREGAFLAAKDGILFLDEIGELPLSLQPKLLRALENREIKSLGSDIPKNYNCRVIAATHRDLSALVAAGKFREDLFYRLNILPLKIPPLRERKEDIPLLADFFLTELNGSISNDALRVLANYQWPGNVRELKNTLIRTFHLSAGNRIAISDLLLNSGINTSLNPDIIREKEFKSLHDLEQHAIETILKQVHGNKSKTARLLGISKSTLLHRLKKYSYFV
ncbi:MAG: hypothetical protein A3F16_02310 [Deltaproteobacteria bacterium RIFCSPHIGHO2_12_FULL_43_9]|nr:MAG: hypothetical protein A3F16_02310 [Deltaproteobacteria bacterium RIFCSPHIGHO2_12_FULL_43_9]